MLEPSEPSQEVAEWLSTLRLSQYTSCFRKGGYQALKDCKHLTDERLLELKVLPTGHRRRILRSLEAIGVKPQSGGEDEEEEEGGVKNRRRQKKPVPHPRHIFLKDRKRGTSCQHHQPKERTEHGSEGSHTLPPGARLGTETEDRYIRPPQPAPRDPQNIRTSMSAPTCIPPSVTSSSSSESLCISEMPSDWEISSEDPSLSSTDSFPCSAEIPHPTVTEEHGGLQCEMVENSIYEAQPCFKASAGPRLTRSYRLRHRPVPEIPTQILPPLLDR